jgi:Mn2+/Fe2+ NRAMP family transporter
LLLHFSMLAACTIGPGTVVTCSKSGADFGLKLTCNFCCDLLDLVVCLISSYVVRFLTGALVLGSFVAYILQEGSARLSIVSGSGLGQVHVLNSTSLFRGVQ